MNFGTRVAAFQPFQCQLEGFIPGRYGFAGEWQSGDKIDTTCAPHVDFTLFFRVGVNQNVRLQPVRLQTKRAIHACFFGHGQQHFQRTVFNAVICQHRQRGSHADAVIRTERGAARFNPFTVYIRANRIGGEIVYCVVIFLRHHIKVCLQNYRLAVFHASGGWFTDQNVANLVAFRMQPLFFRPAHNVTGELFFMVGRVRNRTNFGKNIPQRLWR